MASSMCLSCLKRSLNSIETSSSSLGITPRAAFSTSASLSKAGRALATQPKKKGVAAKPTAKTGRTLVLAKKKRVANARPPAVGERKALRKKVVLSNTNALEIRGLVDLNAGNVSSEDMQRAQQKVIGLLNPTVDTLRALEAFKATQGWNLFRRPATLIRKETVDLARDIERIAEKPSSESILRKLLYGERGSGKSVLQLQAMAMATLRGWIVVHVPEAQDLVNAHTSYEPMKTENGTKYIQPHYTAKLLNNIAKANREVLGNLFVKQQHDLTIPLPANCTLLRVAELGARDPDLAWELWQALWAELSVEGNNLPPVLYTMDGFDHVSRPSAYLDSDVQPIHAHDLALVNHFIERLSGTTSLPNGGMVLAAVSESNKASAHTLHHSIKRNQAMQEQAALAQPLEGQAMKEQTIPGKKGSKLPIPEWDPYVAYDKRVQDMMKTVTVMKLHGLSKEEARGVMEYYARSGMLRNTITDGLVSEKWTLSGGGIIGQIEKGTVQAMRV